VSAAGTPLAGLRVLDLSRVLAGPLCTMMLADLGAEVVKVERPGSGDETRSWGPPYLGGEAAYFLSVNRSKLSCALDLRHPRGQGAARALARSADVVVENFRSGAAARLGLAADQLLEAHPGLVVCSITGYGSARSPASRPGYDFTLQAETGLMSITGHPSGEPTKVGVAIVDVLAGLNAAIAILAALVRREAGGAGEHIEVSLLDAGLAGLVNVAANALAEDSEPPRRGNAHPNIVPYETFETSDGRLAVAAANDASFERMCAALGEEGLPGDGRFRTNADRVRNRTALVGVLEARFRERTTDHWLRALNAADVPVGRIRGVLEALRAAARAGDPATQTIEHPLAGSLELLRCPIRLAQGEIRSADPPPLLGEHTGRVLEEAGLGRDEIRGLARAGVVAGPEL